ncbi:MAG: zf-TFIIB domain-containing protein [Candidatus Omnitrophica bacterium]|nr:zf-TFIIB domain-containing protein [Candidatus Omnitrophota bacterium]
MNCPACGHQLVEKKVRDVVVDVCQGGCGGLWLDNLEIKKLDESHEHVGEELLNVPRQSKAIVDHQKKRSCPKCEGTVMMRHFFSPQKEAEVDVCGQCGGLWLDVGELANIRNQYKTEKERHDAAEKYFTELFGHDLAQARAQSQAELAQAQKVARAFRFICPSYYIPGKQKGGAF